MRCALVALVLALGCSPAARTAPSTSPTATATVVTTVTPTPTQTANLTARPTSRPRDLAMIAAQRIVGDRVTETLGALARRDGPALAALAHPIKGVRFSLSPLVRPDTDVVLRSSDLASAFTSPATRTWGITDGSGLPIVLTYGDYHTLYVYGRDFVNARWVSYNHPIGAGNSIDNTADIYPDAIFFEAYDPGSDPARSDTQWQSIRLLFEQSGDRWYLVGVVHGAWTI